MNAWLAALRVFGIALLCLIGILLLLLLVPVTLDIRYARGALVVRARYGPFGLKVLDTGEKQERKRPRKTAQAGEKQQPEEKREIDLELIRRLLKPGFRALRSVAKSLKIRNVRIVLVASGEESDEIGIKAGIKWAALGGVLTAANRIWDNIEYNELTVIPDFSGSHKDGEKIGCSVTAVPVIIAAIALVFLARYRKIKKQRGRQREQARSRKAADKKETNHESTPHP